MQLKEEKELIGNMKLKVNRGNVDNVSRTVFYLRFYEKHPEIRWALLASAVSRNAGWNMTDLASNWFERMIPKQYRHVLFMTYERANWLIFEDAFPQLLIYELSKEMNRPMFHLLDYFQISSFMKQEWERFWHYPHIERICTALIINEQHVIQKPVIEHPFYKEKVFRSLPFFLEDFFHYSAVLFPTFDGTLYGYTISNFTEVNERIKLGKRLMHLLFSSEVKDKMQLFLKKTEHTGSRRDFERLLGWKAKKTSPFLRTVYGIVQHHRQVALDWSQDVTAASLKRYFKEETRENVEDMTNWYKRVQTELFICMKMEEILVPGKM